MKRGPSSYQVGPDGVVRFERLIGTINLISSSSESTHALTGIVRPGAVTLQSTLSGVQGQALEHARIASQIAKINPIRAMEQLDTAPAALMLFAFECTPRTRAYIGSLAAEGLAPDPAPTARDKAQTDYADQYVYLGDLAGGKPRQLNPGGVEPAGSATLYPRVVQHDMQLWRDIAGQTNRETLDAMAASIVERELAGDEQSSGESGETVLFLPITPTGAVAYVEHSLSANGVSSTRWKSGVDNQTEARQTTQLRVAGTAGLGTKPGSIVNPSVGRRG